jgi:hypothetical protein
MEFSDLAEILAQLCKPYFLKYPTAPYLYFKQKKIMGLLDHIFGLGNWFCPHGSKKQSHMGTGKNQESKSHDSVPFKYITNTDNLFGLVWF